MTLRSVALLLSGLLSAPAFAHGGGGGGHGGGGGGHGGGGFHAAGGGGFHGGGSVTVHAPGVAVHAPGVAVHAPGVAVRAPGVSVRGPAVGVRGPGVVVGAPGPRGVYGRGYGGRVYVGRPAFSRPYYSWGGRYYARPIWAPGRVEIYRRGFYGYPGYRAYGTYYGLVPPLAPFAGLAFLSAGLLTASYLANDHTVYVYMVQQDGQNVEYRVDDTGEIISQQVIP